MSADPNEVSLEEQAAASFCQPMQGEWSSEDQDALEARLETDPAYAAAYRRVTGVWAALDAHAESPELLARRQHAIAYARRVSARRWFGTSRYTRAPWRAAAALAGMAVVLGAAWQLSPYGYKPGTYHTGIGEQRMVELDDRSRIELDAATTVRVRYSESARIVELMQGQAQFAVAKDPVRPFRVQAGDHTIVALGTVFTVEYVGRKIHVAMMEGRVAVVPDRSDSSAMSARTPDNRQPPGASVSAPPSASVPATADPQRDIEEANTAIELSAGQELRVSQDGRTTVIPQADIEAATAWRERKVIFRAESLGEAVQRLNRYSRLQIEVADTLLATQEISGVFDIGDTQGFVRDIQRYLPVTADSTGSDKITLRIR